MIRERIVSAADLNRPVVPDSELAFEGAGGGCWEFDGVFAAGFFGVLFEG
jgi:hypothetical protein